MGQKIQVKLGVGFNISNQHPTECLNRILAANGLSEWPRELFLARFLNKFDAYVNQLGNVRDPTALPRFLAEFEQHWIHK